MQSGPEFGSTAGPYISPSTTPGPLDASKRSAKRIHRVFDEKLLEVEPTSIRMVPCTQKLVTLGEGPLATYGTRARLVADFDIDGAFLLEVELELVRQEREGGANHPIADGSRMVAPRGVVSILTWFRPYVRTFGERR